MIASPIVKPNGWTMELTPAHYRLLSSALILPVEEIKSP